ncbi:MAG: amidohydrolase/deacetylase family metallohydrolase [Bryobacterales bacterium]|nr:amidohydrolase/deacetylase family metallohydrolase [Bryobacterales bacterium]
MRLSALLLAAAAVASAQQYDLLIKGGHVIDPANSIDRVMDVAVTGNSIARVAQSIDRSQAKKVIDATGYYVTPGLIDLHAHTFGYSGSIKPDDTHLPAGTTTVIDAGGPGYKTIDEFRKLVVNRSRTRVYALINIAGGGMVGNDVESDVSDMLPDKTAAAIKANRDIVVGIKTAHFGRPGYAALERAVEAGKLANVPVMVDLGILSPSDRTTKGKLERLRPGDIATHMYNDRQLELVDRFRGRVQPWSIEARKRGVIFDMGHGGGSFMWPVAAAATREGFYPDTISTDLHASSIMGTKSDMPNCISKMVVLGMSLQEAIMRSTVTPAKAISKFPEHGTLGEGKNADIAILKKSEGVFPYFDAWLKKHLGNVKIESVLTVRDGKIVYDVDGLAFPEWTTAGDYTVIP